MTRILWQIYCWV